MHTVRISCLIGFQIRLYFFDQIPNDRDIRNNGNGLFQNNSNWRLMHQSAFQKRSLDRPILRLFLKIMYSCIGENYFKQIFNIFFNILTSNWKGFIGLLHHLKLRYLQIGYDKDLPRTVALLSMKPKVANPKAEVINTSHMNMFDFVLYIAKVQINTLIVARYAKKHQKCVKM